MAPTSDPLFSPTEQQPQVQAQTQLTSDTPPSETSASGSGSGSGSAKQQLPHVSTDYDDSFPSLTRSSTVPASLRSSELEANTSSNNGNSNGNGAGTRRTDPYHLAPEDAFYNTQGSQRARDRYGHQIGHVSSHHHNNTGGSGGEMRDQRVSRQPQRLGALGGGGGGLGRMSRGLGAGSRSRSRRRRRRTWKKLLWVKQSYPDNYTDQATFLENLQRNPRLQPYDFWPLVADSTVIVQHVCSVAIFVICFVGIFQDRVSPVAVAGWGSFATCMGWLLWEWWADHEPEAAPDNGLGLGLPVPSHGGGDDNHPPPCQQPQRRPRGDALPNMSMLPSAASSTTSLLTMANSNNNNNNHNHNAIRRHSGGPTGNATSWNPTPQSGSAAVSGTTTRTLAPSANGLDSGTAATAAASTSGIAAASGAASGTNAGTPCRPGPTTPVLRPLANRRSLPLLVESRTHHRFATVKSAVLIYFTLLSLSPILKSLTRSTSSDSIWAMSFWLLAINIFFFDYSGAWVGAHKVPVASLSTNAALMASTVLASRLPETSQVFSLTLFSIEVFGLFPVFRRYTRHRSWRYHVVLTFLLVLGAGAGVGIVLASSGEDVGAPFPWRSAVAGMVVGCLLSAVTMGGCSWWLIGLQKYKNEIYGPWDPARPIIISRRHWDD